MARDYQAEQRARDERARGKGYRSYGEERQAKFHKQQIESKREDPRYAHLPAPSAAPTSFAEDELGPPGLQGPFGPSPDPAWDYYWPTRTINPPRPRTLQARYSGITRELQVIFRDGTPWTYEQVPPGLWVRFKRVESPGRFINNVLNGFPYARGGWGSIVGEG